MQVFTRGLPKEDGKGATPEGGGLDPLESEGAPGKKTVRLTPRELEVLRWVAAGKSDWQIGQILNISAKTANYHVENLKRKFGVSTRLQAIAEALRQGQLR
jgi:DNA-binding CsgD family transcriptional regulator